MSFTPCISPAPIHEHHTRTWMASRASSNVGSALRLSHVPTGGLHVNYELVPGALTFSGRVDACGHVFCCACLIGLFEKEKASSPWFYCPDCWADILVPPKPDERLLAVITWLLFAQGDQLSDTPPTATPPTDESIFDRYFGDI
jgi:hypothetical protein